MKVKLLEIKRSKEGWSQSGWLDNILAQTQQEVCHSEEKGQSLDISKASRYRGHDFLCYNSSNLSSSESSVRSGFESMSLTSEINASIYGTNVVSGCQILEFLKMWRLFCETVKNLKDYTFYQV